MCNSKLSSEANNFSHVPNALFSLLRMKGNPAGSLKYWRNLVAKDPELALNENDIKKASTIRIVKGD